MRRDAAGHAQDRAFRKFLAHFANRPAGLKGVTERRDSTRRQGSKLLTAMR